MNKTRLEAFSDGVLAIIITIMILEFKAPEQDTFKALAPLLPKLFVYILSFVYVGTLWNNHHHLLHISKHINGKVLWANLHLLFWASLLPFATDWLGENHFSGQPMMLYGIIVFMLSFAYTLLEVQLIKTSGKTAEILKVIGRGWKEKSSIALNLAGIGCAYFVPVIGGLCYTIVGLIWIIPDKRIEKNINNLTK